MPKGGSVKMKKIMPKQSPEDVELMKQMFDQMTGISQADMDVILPKYIKLKNLLTNFYKTYNVLLTFKPLHDSLSEYKCNFDEIQNFIDKLKESCDLNVDLHEKENLYYDKTQEDLNNLYKKLKDNECIKLIISTCGNLSRHSKFINDRKNLDDGFIKREPGLSMILLSFSNLDFKHIWISPKMTNMIKKFILNIISHTFEIGYEVYDIITSPDIDIRKFSNVLVTSLDKLRKQIPRCDHAFNIILDSVKMLENNFKGYYKSSVEAHNPSIILESFVIDISTKQHHSPKVTQEFRKIIMHIRKVAGNNNDPRVKKLFGMLNNQFKMMEDHSKTSTEEKDVEKDVEKDDL